MEPQENNVHSEPENVAQDAEPVVEPATEPVDKKRPKKLSIISVTLIIVAALAGVLLFLYLLGGDDTEGERLGSVVGVVDAVNVESGVIEVYDSESQEYYSFSIEPEDRIMASESIINQNQMSTSEINLADIPNGADIRVVYSDYGEEIDNILVDISSTGENLLSFVAGLETSMLRGYLVEDNTDESYVEIIHHSNKNGESIKVSYADKVNNWVSVQDKARAKIRHAWQMDPTPEVNEGELVYLVFDTSAKDLNFNSEATGLVVVR